MTARRIAVVDDRGVPRLVAEVVGDTVELRLEVPGGAPGRRSAVVLHASGPATSSHGQPGPGPLIGVQLWAEGDAVAELDAWPGEDGHWRPHLHLSGGS
ncbi:MAG: hypothetical protein ACRDY3_02355 [Acidimicrobiales bacterium]